MSFAEFGRAENGELAGLNHAIGPGFHPMPNAIAIWWIVSLDGCSETQSAAKLGLC